MLDHVTPAEIYVHMDEGKMTAARNQAVKYLTGFTTTVPRSSACSSKGRGWIISFIKHRGGSIGGTLIGKRVLPAGHLIIETSSPDKANEISDLVYACYVVISACDYVGFDLLNIYGSVPVILDERCRSFPERLYSPRIYMAGIMASKASHKESHVYATHKLCFSYQTYAAAPIDLDPHGGNLPTPNLANPFPPSVRIRMADAIVSSYSAIEELGLDIQASASSPSKDKHGNWLPEKRAEVISRLAQANINTKEGFVWDLRGGRTIIERKSVFTRRGKKSPWANGVQVRDEEIDLVDAIDRASFLRSQIASHKFSSTKSARSKLIRVLSVYDVSNVQLLARRLILESLKLWRV